MALRLSELAGKRKRLELEFLGEKFWVEYRPNGLSLSQIKAAIEEVKDIPESQAVELLCNQLEQLLIAWDVVGADGKAVETTAAAIKKEDIPFMLLAFVINSVNTDMRALGEANGGNSKTGSFRKG